MFKKLKRNMAASRLVEEQQYEHVLNEMNAGEIRPGLLAKALANGAGDDQIARGHYIKYRLQAMRDETEVSSAIAEKAQSDAAIQTKEAAAKLKMQEKQRIKTLKKTARHAGAKYIKDR